MNFIPPEPATIIGRASVIDADTIEIHGQRIRLWGIDAPERRQTCTRAGESYRCGTEAANALSAQIGQATVACRPRGGPDRYRRVVAVCYRYEFESSRVRARTLSDLGGYMVARGWAVDFPRYSRSEYAPLQREAQAARRGVWAGEFKMPWEWRAAR